MIYNTNFLCSLQFPNFSIFYFRLQGGNYTFPKLTRTEKSWLPFFVCHVIVHAYFNFTYATPGRFYIKVAVYTNGFMSVRLSKIVIWDWVENFTLENVKSTLKYGIITYKHSLYCMWILHLSSSWSNSVKNSLTHLVGVWFSLQFTHRGVYIPRYNSRRRPFSFQEQTNRHRHKNTLCAKHKVHPRNRLQLISASHSSCFHFHLKHHFVIILLWWFGYNNGLLTKLTLFISIIFDV